MNKKPNILWIMTDQQHDQMMSCAGNKYVNTPNIDSIANDGVRFTNAYCANPVCMASRFSMITGLYPSYIGQKSNAFRDEVTQPLPEVIFENGVANLFKDEGYQTVYGGKEHFPYFTAKDVGFDYVCKDERYELADSIAGKIKEADEDKPFFMVASFINPHDICLMAISDFAERTNNQLDKLLSNVCRTEYIEVTKAKKTSEQWSPEEFYGSICPPVPENYIPSEDEPEAISIIQNQRQFKKLAREEYTDEQWRLHRWAYCKLTEQVDEQIGTVLQAVKDKGVWDNTVIIFTSDHGDLDSAHKMEHKTALYNESTHVPFIVKGINGNTGVSDELVSNGLDILPTIYDYAGIKKPEYLKGLSIKPTVESNSPTREFIKVESEFGKMVAMKDCVYHRYDVGARNEQFYDKVTNPYEKFNQINDKQFENKVKACKEFLNSFEEN